MAHRADALRALLRTAGSRRPWQNADADSQRRSAHATCSWPPRARRFDASPPQSSTIGFVWTSGSVPSIATGFAASDHPLAWVRRNAMAPPTPRAGSRPTAMKCCSSICRATDTNSARIPEKSAPSSAGACDGSRVALGDGRCSCPTAPIYARRRGFTMRSPPSSNGEKVGGTQPPFCLRRAVAERAQRSLPRCRANRDSYGARGPQELRCASTKRMNTR